MTVASVADTTFAGTIFNNGSVLSLVKSGSNTLTLTGSNNYSGQTSVNAGILQLGNNNALGTGGLTANAGTVDLAAYSPMVQSLAGSAGTITNSGMSESTLAVNQSTTTTFSGAINDGANPVALAKMATGTLTLSGSSNYSGGTTLNNGTLVVNNAASLGSSSGSLSIGAATLEVANSFSSLRNIGLNSPNSNIQVDPSQVYTNSGAITSSSSNSLNLTGAGTFVLAGGGNVGAFNVNAGSLVVNGSLTAGVMNISNAAQFSGTGSIATTGDSLYFSSSTPSTFAGAIVSSVQGIEVDSGSLTLSGTNNTFAGGAAIAGGTLAVGANNALPTATTLTFGSPASNGTFDLAGNHQTVGGLSIAATNAPALQLIGNSSTSANALLDFSSTGSSDFAGTIQDDLGSGTMTTALAVSGGTLELSGSNSFTGGTTVSDGTLILANNEALADGSSLTVGDASAFAPAPVVPSLAVSRPPTITAVPEPGTLVLLVAGAAMLVMYRRRRQG